MESIVTRRPQLKLAATPKRKLGSAKRRARQIIITRDRRYEKVRRDLSAHYLTGSGLEIGALHMPLHVPAGVSVRYVDRLHVAELREHYPELAGYDLVTPDIIDDGEVLGSVPDSSVDFVIANHMIEHCEDPIGTLQNHLRVLRPGAILYMAVPDCRHTFDRHRRRTSIDHLQRDHDEGPSWSRRGHYEEWAQHIDGARNEDVAAGADDLQRREYSIHFHVWTPTTFVEMLSHCRSRLGLPLEIEAMTRNEHEFIVILSRAEAD
jgi:SAM-dependent methyltransferase